MRLKREIIRESSLNRVRKAWTEHDTGTITAYRDIHDCGNGAPLTNKEKSRRNSVLSSKLKLLGYGITKVKGSWFENSGKEVSEASYFIVDVNDKGTLRKDLITLGKLFDQDAITFAEAGDDYYAISTNECPDSWPGFGKVGKSEKLGKPKFGKSGINGFSKVNNRAFVFEGFHIETTKNCGLNGFRTMRHLDSRYHDKDSILRIGEDIE